jgi:hypothetical protein
MFLCECDLANILIHGLLLPVHHGAWASESAKNTQVAKRKLFRRCLYTDEKENKIFLKYKDIQMGSGAKSYMRKDFLIYGEMRPIYEEAVSHTVYVFAPDPL